MVPTNFLDLSDQEGTLKVLVESHEGIDEQKVVEALELAKIKHSTQLRDEGSPYIIHPIRVAICLIGELGIFKTHMIVAALLHDAIEDTDLTCGEIEQKFGKRVAEIVKALTRNKDQETKWDKFQKTLKADEEIRTIKACDWLDNLRSWAYIPRSAPAITKFPRWFEEAKKMYIPLAESVNNQLAQKASDALQRVKNKFSYLSLPRI